MMKSERKQENVSPRAACSLATKTAAILLLIITLFLALASGVGIVFSAVYGIYEGTTQEQLREKLTTDYLDSVMYDFLANPYEEMSEWAKAQSGLYYRIDDESGSTLAGNYTGEAELSHVEWKTAVTDSDDASRVRVLTLHLWASSAVMHGRYLGLYKYLTVLSNYRLMNIAVCLVSLAVSVFLFVFLLNAAGRHPDEDNVREGAAERIPFDLFSFLAVLAEAAMLFAMLKFFPISGENSFSVSVLYAVILYIPTALLFIGYMMSTAVRIKTGNILRHTLIGMLVHAVRQMFALLFRAVHAVLRATPTVKRSILLLLALLLLNFSVGYALIVGNCFFIFLWLVLIEMAVFGIFALRYQSGWHRLQDGASHLAKGEFNYRVDSSGLPDACRIPAETLNHIGQGLSEAVEERMKNERFRTELITNVSHDIKTPLTSVINYVDLIRQRSSDDEVLLSYIDVLDKQSARLKKLIDDLLEASKASSRVLNVTLTPCEVGILLEQVKGEYAERLAARNLNLVVQTPESPLTILADEKHLGRIFDNLMSNILKYSQAGTRVYLESHEEMISGDNGKVKPAAVITFRNISAEPLNMPAEELMERFVRGDISRHSEGSGLGLAIVRSLTELQGGSLQLFVDGDLFKACLSFPLYSAEEANPIVSSTHSSSQSC